MSNFTELQRLLMRIRDQIDELEAFIESMGLKKEFQEFIRQRNEPLIQPLLDKETRNDELSFFETDKELQPYEVSVREAAKLIEERANGVPLAEEQERRFYYADRTNKKGEEAYICYDRKTGEREVCTSHEQAQQWCQEKRPAKKLLSEIIGKEAVR